MDGGFLVDDLFATHPAVSGGNLLLLGTDSSATLPAAEAAVGAMKDVADGILSRRVCRRPADGTVSPGDGRRGGTRSIPNPRSPGIDCQVLGFAAYSDFLSLKEGRRLSVTGSGEDQLVPQMP